MRLRCDLPPPRFRNNLSNAVIFFALFGDSEYNGDSSGLVVNELAFSSSFSFIEEPKSMKYAGMPLLSGIHILDGLISACIILNPCIFASAALSSL